MNSSTPGRPGRSMRIRSRPRRTAPSGPFRNQPPITSALFSTVLLNSSPMNPMISSRRSASSRLPPRATGSVLRSVTAATDPAKVGGSGGAGGPGAAGGGSDSSGTSVSAATSWVGTKVVKKVGAAVAGATVGGIGGSATA